MNVPDEDTPSKDPRLPTAAPRESEGGVYHTVRPRVRLTEQDLYVPRFLSREFFRFLAGFLLHPAGNAVFVREWRRNRHRTGLVGHHWLAFSLLASFVFTLLGIGVVMVIRAASGSIVQELILIAAFFAPAFVASFYGLFTSIQGSVDLQDRGKLEELALTPLRPQEIVFGQLAGGLLPVSLLAIPMVPGYLIIALDATVIRPINPQLGPIAGLAIFLGFFPNLASALLSSGAISSAVSYGEMDFSKALFKSITTWVVLVAVMAFPVLTSVPGAVGSLMAGSSGGVVDALVGIIFVILPYWILMRFLVIGGFLHHLAVRVARAQVEEMWDVN